MGAAYGPASWFDSSSRVSKGETKPVLGVMYAQDRP
jgi:hypothetical protein